MSTPILKVMLAAALSVAAAPAVAETPGRLRGTIVSLDGYVLHLKTDLGREVTVSFAPDYIVTALAAASMSEVSPGLFVGTAAVSRTGGPEVASEVHIFPANLRGTAAGRQSVKAGNRTTSVTNGTVVGWVADATGGTLTLSYPAGEASVTVPPGIPVVRFMPGRRSMLSAGAHVVIQPQAVHGQAAEADSVIVGEDGLVPPM